MEFIFPQTVAEWEAWAPWLGIGLGGVFSFAVRMLREKLLWGTAQIRTALAGLAVITLFTSQATLGIDMGTALLASFNTVLGSEGFHQFVNKNLDE